MSVILLFRTTSADYFPCFLCVSPPVSFLLALLQKSRFQDFDAVFCASLLFFRGETNKRLSTHLVSTSFVRDTLVEYFARLCVCLFVYLSHSLFFSLSLSGFFLYVVLSANDTATATLTFIHHVSRSSAAVHHCACAVPAAAGQWHGIAS